MPGVRIVRDVVPGGRILLRFFAIVSSDDYILKSRLKKIKKMLKKKNIKKIIIFFCVRGSFPLFYTRSVHETVRSWTLLWLRGEATLFRMILGAAFQDLQSVRPVRCRVLQSCRSCSGSIPTGRSWRHCRS